MLELTIIDGLSVDNPSQKKKEFDDRGGVIGRDLQADWVLFDTRRVISSQHAKVIFSQGAYYFSDLSVNGITTEQGIKLRKGEYRLLKLGEIYQIGPYRIEVSGLETEHKKASFADAGLGYLLNDDSKETPKGITPFDYVQKQSEPLDFPWNPQAKTLKAFDFMPEPIDFLQGQSKVEKTETFIPKFCDLFQLNARYFEGIEDEMFEKSIRTLFKAMFEKYLSEKI